MPLEFDQDSLIGDLIPNVLIKKITLTTGFSYQKGRGADPHFNIPTPDELPDNLKGLYENLYEDVEISPQDLANGQGDFSEVENFDILKDKTTQVELELVVKDTLDNNLLSSWFDNIDFTKFIKIRVVQSTNQFISEGFIDGRKSILNIDYLKIPNVGVEYQDISLTSDETKIDRFIEDVDVNGKKYYDIQFSLSFQFPTTSISHLMYFAQTYIDPIALAQSFDPPLTELGPFNDFVGKMVFDPVLINGNVSDTSDVYVDEKEMVWLGPVTQEPDGRLLKGKERPSGLNEEQLINGLFYVTKTVVPNVKIHDFRDIDIIRSLDFDFNDLEETLLEQASDIKFTSGKVFSPNYNDVFSELWISRDENNNARLAFGINLERLIKQNSHLFRIYENLPEFTKSELFSTVNLRNFKVTRNRLTKEGSIFDENAPNVIVANGLEQLIDNGNIRELKLNIEGFNHYQILDRQIGKESTGLWQYTISFDFEDVLPQYLNNLLSELNLSSKGLLEFYSKATQPKNYEPSTDTYKVNFIESSEVVYEDEIVPLLSKYFEVLQYLTGPLTNFDKFVKTFNVLLNPRTGSPKGFLTILKLINDLESKLSSIISGLVVNNRVEQVGGTIVLGGTKKQKSKLNTVQYTFKETFDATPEINMGYEYLFEDRPVIEKNTLGLIITSYDLYRSRVEKEALKYFQSLASNIEFSDSTVDYNPGDSIENSIYSHLSPARLLVSTKQPLEQLKLGVASDETYAYYMSEILDYNNEDIYSFSSELSDDSSKLDKEQQRLASKLRVVLGGKGTTISYPKSKFKISDDTNSKISFDDTDSKNKLSKKDFDTNVNNALLTLIGFSSLDLEDKSIDDFNLNLEKTKERFVKLGAATFLQNLLGIYSDPIRELPNQLKQLILTFIKPEVVNVLFDSSTESVKQGSKYFRMFMLYYNLVQIEYLDSYETIQTGKKAINGPQWKVLSQNVFEDSKASNRILLCRVRQYQNNIFNLKVDKNLELPILNEYFLIKNPDVSEDILQFAPTNPIVNFEEASKPVNNTINKYKPISLNSSGIL